MALVMEFFVERGVFLLGCDHAQFDHVVQDVFLTLFGTFGVDQGIGSRGEFGQSGQHGGLRQGQLLNRFVEIDLRGSRETVGALPEIDLVEVQFQNLVFG